MIDISALQARIIDGLHPYVAPYGVTAIIERDQDAPKPPYPFIGLRGLSALLGAGMQLSSCEEVAGPPSPAVGVPATGRRVPPGAGGGPVPRISWHDRYLTDI